MNNEEKIFEYIKDIVQVNIRITALEKDIEKVFNDTVKQVVYLENRINKLERSLNIHGILTSFSFIVAFLLIAHIAHYI